MNDEFSLDGSEYIELAQVLKIMGVAQTGGHAKIIIQEGEVKVNGEVETRRRYKSRAGDVIEHGSSQIKIV